MKSAEELIEDRITDYLSAGGLFNPEMMEHDKVRSLLIDCREECKHQQSKQLDAYRAGMRHGVVICKIKEELLTKQGLHSEALAASDCKNQIDKAADVLKEIPR